MQSLIFFNKEGDNLNFTYDQDEELWQGDLIFHQNSDDTFKTVGLYVFEKIPSFEYERPGDLQLEKFQLFNEYRFNISGSTYFTQSIIKIQISNNDPTFYSKWVYGDDFEAKFPVGSQVRFDYPFLEFGNYNRSYTVVKTKKNAILIMSDLDNRTFNEQYGSLIEESSTYNFYINSVTYSYSISGINSIGIYDYIKPDYSDNLSSWSEPNFYDRFFNGRVLNLINTKKNDGIYNIKNVDLNDKVYSRYTYDARFLTQSVNLLLDVLVKSELPSVYSGPLTLTGSKVYFSSGVPNILKPGMEFYLPDSQINANNFKISDIQKYESLRVTTKFDVESQVIFGNKIYQCIQAHTWSATSSITPTADDYWSVPTYLKVSPVPEAESFGFTDVFIELKNRFTYSQSFTQSVESTFGSSVEKYSQSLALFNIDYYIENKILYADLLYPAEYAEVKILIGTDSYVDVTNKVRIYEKNVEIEENLLPEISNDVCSNFSYNVVFTDIDEFGIRIVINDQVFYQSVEFIYDGIYVNMERTIDKTLRNWMTTWYLQLAITGVIPKLKFTGKAYSFYLNTIQLTTEYPNVPLEFSVQVGTTANYYLQRAQVIFNKVGTYLSVTVNRREYTEKVIYSNGVSDLEATLKNWVDNYGIILEGYGIYVDPVLSMLAFNVKEKDTRFEISVKTGASVLPGMTDYIINDFFVGNFGSLLTSNSVVLTYATYSFEDEKFSTGQLVSINNSNRVWNNQEYNIEYLGPNMLNLSYQGPFWPSLDPLCNVSPFITIALSNGFGATGCTIASPVTLSGEFNTEYSRDFFIYANRANEYVLNTDFPTSDTKRFVDVIYLSLVNRIYVMGEKMTIINSITNKIVDEIVLPGLTGGISMHFNEYNNYLYCLSTDKIFLIDPVYPRLDYTFELGSRPVNCGINPDTGDVYVSYGTNEISIWYYNNYTSTPSLTFSYTSIPSSNFYRFAYNKSEKDMYVTGDDALFRFNGSSRTIEDNYPISGLKQDIYYEPQNSSLYVFDTSYINNVNGGVVQQIDLGLRMTEWLPQPSGTTSNLNDIGFFDQNKGIIIGDKGSIIVTENAGENWVNKTSTTAQNLNSLSIISNSIDIGWAVAGGDNGTVIYTSDYGNSWQALTSVSSYKVNGIHFVDSVRGYAALDNGFVAVYTVPGGFPQWTVKSNFGSTSFKSVWANSDSSKVIFVGDGDAISLSSYNLNSSTQLSRRSPLNSVFVTSTVISVVGDESIIFRSLDKTNWYTVDPLTHPRSWQSVYFDSPTLGWAVGSLGSIRKTTDGGSTWASRTSNVTGITLSSVHFLTSSIGMAGGDNGTIIFSENGGDSWGQHRTLSNTNWTTNKINGVRVISHTGGLSTKIAVGNNGTVLRSDSTDYRRLRSIGTVTVTGTLTDGTFNNVTSYITNTVNGTGASFNIVITLGIPSVTISSTGGGYLNGEQFTVYDADLGGTSADNFITFRVTDTISIFTTISVPTTQNLNDVVFSTVNPQFGIIVGNSGVCLRTVNSGLIWSPIAISGAGNLLSLCTFVTNWWICGANGRIYRSTDSGANFNLASTLPDSVDVNSISFIDASNGTAVDSWGRIWNSSNGGSSWTQVKFDYNSVSFVDDDYGWVAGKNGIILRTTDGGAIWNYVYSGTTQSITSIYFADTNIGYISGPDSLLRKNSQGGISRQWLNQDSGNSTLNNFAFTDTLTGYVVGDNGEIHKVEKDPPAVRNLAFNKTRELMYLSTPSGLYTFDLNGVLINKGITNEFGPLAVNDLDGDVYLATQVNQKLLVYDSENFYYKHQVFFPEGRVRKVIYNPDRQSIFGIIPNTFVEQQSLFELSVSLGGEIQVESPIYETVDENNYGTLDKNYEPHPDLWLKTREYIRKPRANYNNDPTMDFVWKWEDDQKPQIFLYDFSGEQLSTTASIAYIGPKPLPLVALNRKPNKKLDRVGLSEFQQTIFDEISHTLPRVDESEDLSNKPTPMEIFIGINSPDEGVLSSTLNLYERERISFTINANSTNNDVIQFSLGYSPDDDFYGMIVFSVNSFSNFRQDVDGVPRGLKPGQLLKISVTDNQNKKNKYISSNNGITFKILRVFTKYIMVKFIDRIITEEFTQIDDYPNSGNITYLTVKFEVVDKLIGKFNIVSETEIEDVRYKIELSNTGHLVDPYDTFIFKDYDINEQGIDWSFLNKKRKELLMVRDQIFPYIGSYKSIINAINYFGYNDLELYEYYRNIDINSDDFFKLFKVEIPDIFDNSVPGWNENDFIKHTLPNPFYEETNLFNLTYKITDKEGTNVLMYSLAEVILKLQGLKLWLERKIIPISHRILDITGRADFVGVNTITHKNYDVKILNHRTDFTPVDFSLDEAYLMPINSGSTVYTCQVKFFMGYVPTYSVTPDYFTVKIRTYKTYKEWNPFTIYQVGDRVIYYGVIYESAISNNKIKDPRKYRDVLDWNINTDYYLGEFALYNREVYQYIGTQSSYIIFGTSSTINPYYDVSNNGATASWFLMTEWRKVDLKPVQNLIEYRITATYSLDLRPSERGPAFGELPPPIKAGQPYNFTIDSNIDPFIVIEVTSDNGYGQNFTQKKNYEIRGLNDIADPIKYIDPIGPFTPITQITNSL